MPKLPLLTTKQMAHFVDDGFLRFDELIPHDLCQRLMRDIGENAYVDTSAGRAYQEPLAGLYAGTALGEIVELPAMRGIIHSLVGPDCLYDHHVVHTLPKQSFKPNSGSGSLHQDFP